jgi:hypothetical protein
MAPGTDNVDNADKDVRIARAEHRAENAASHGHEGGRRRLWTLERASLLRSACLSNRTRRIAARRGNSPRPGPPRARVPFMCDAAFVLRGSLFFGEDPLVVGRPGHAGSAGRVQRRRRARYRHTARRAARGCSEAGSSGLVVSPRPPRASATPGRVSGNPRRVRESMPRDVLGRILPPPRSRDPRLRLGADDPRPLPPPRRRATPDTKAWQAKQGGAWVSTSWAEFHGKALSLATFLAGQGLAPLATRSASSAALAPNGASATSADSSPRSSRSARIPRSRRISSRTCSITRTCGSSSSRAAAELEKVLEIKRDLPKLELVVVWRPAGLEEALRTHDWLITWDAALQTPGDADLVAERVRSIDPDHPAFIVYTSGTTGPPKGAMISHANILVTLKGATFTSFARSDISLSFLPMAHVAERILAFWGSHRLRHRHRLRDQRAGRARGAQGGPPHPLRQRPAHLREGPRAHPGRGRQGPAAPGSASSEWPSPRASRSSRPGRAAGRRRCRRGSRIGSPTGSCSRGSARPSAGASSCSSPAPPRSRARSSPSSGPRACRSTRCTA